MVVTTFVILNVGKVQRSGRKEGRCFLVIEFFPSPKVVGTSSILLGNPRWTRGSGWKDYKSGSLRKVPMASVSPGEQFNLNRISTEVRNVKTDHLTLDCFVHLFELDYSDKTLFIDSDSIRRSPSLVWVSTVCGSASVSPTKAQSEGTRQTFTTDGHDDSPRATWRGPRLTLST